MPARVNKILAFVVWQWVALAGAQQKHYLLPLSPEERTAVSKRLDLALLPTGASHRNMDPKQAFKLMGPSGVELNLVSVDFDVPNSNAGVLRHTCGMYVIPAHASAYFLDDSNSDETLPVQCWKIVSVRLVRKGAEPPDIVFTGENSLTSHAWLQEYVMSHDEGGSYKLSVDYKDAP